MDRLRFLEDLLWSVLASFSWIGSSLTSLKCMTGWWGWKEASIFPRNSNMMPAGAHSSSFNLTHDSRQCSIKQMEHKKQSRATIDRGASDYGCLVICLEAVDGGDCLAAECMALWLCCCVHLLLWVLGEGINVWGDGEPRFRRIKTFNESLIACKIAHIRCWWRCERVIWSQSRSKKMLDYHGHRPCLVHFLSPAPPCTF